MVLTTLVNILLEYTTVLTVLFLLVCFLYASVLFLFYPKSGRNPFSLRYVRPPPERLETDRKTRNSVLKQKFKPEAIPEDLDAIVIGSGISGLSTAVMLSRVGQKVLVLEQHKRAGGCCHTYNKKGYEFDTGIHYVGKMNDGELMRVLFDQITEGQVTWIPMDKDYDKIAVGPSSKPRMYSMVSGTSDKFAANLEKQFPNQKEAITKLINLINEGESCFMRGFLFPKTISLTVAKKLINTKLFHIMFRKYMKLCDMSLKYALDEISDDEEFKNVLAYAFGDFGVPPSELGVVGYSVVMNHLKTGAFYPLGGPSEIAFQIIPIIERYGGRVMTGAPVTEILVDEKGRANGVKVHRKSGDIKVFAKRIISAAGIRNTFQYLLPREIASNTPLFKMIDEVGPSISCLTVFVGINGSSEELGMTASNTWALRSNNTEAELRDYWAMPVEQAAESQCPLLFVSFPSAKDPSWEQKYPGKSVALLITLTPWYWFCQWKDEKVKHRGDQYNDLKQKIGQQMWKQTKELYPQLSGKLDFIDVGTPLTNKHYLGQPEGEMYGLDHMKSRFRPEVSMLLRPESGIPGLYLTGQDIVTSGFCGALHSSALTVGAILNRHTFKDLIGLTKEIRIGSKEKKTV